MDDRKWQTPIGYLAAMDDVQRPFVQRPQDRKKVQELNQIFGFPLEFNPSCPEGFILLVQDGNIKAALRVKE